MRELFVYYRVRSDNAAAAHAAVQRLQAQLRHDDPHLSARLLRRPEEENGLQTWMEIYADEAGITEAMQARIEASAHALLPFIDGSRHTEVFIACAS
jgi:quinol monooxygenase YgiN